MPEQHNEGKLDVPRAELERKLGELSGAKVGETHVRGMGGAGPFAGHIGGVGVVKIPDNPVSADQLQVREHAVQYALEISRMNSDGYEATAEQVVKDAGLIEDYLSNGAKGGEG